MSARVVLAVDFGTFNTVAVLARGAMSVEPLLFDGAPTMPSAVLSVDGGRFLVGRDAQRAAASDPVRLEPNPKRRIDDVSVLLGETEYPTVELIGAVLARVGEVARQVTGGKLDEVVLTHPAAWGAARRETLVNAAKASGLSNNPGLVPEPVAAAQLFMNDGGHWLEEGCGALVYDLGAGTCDLTLLVRRSDRVEVAATDGMNDVGGLDVDHVIVEHLRQQYPSPQAWDRLAAPATPSDRRQRRLLWEDVRSAKELLSREPQAAIHIPLLDMDTHLTRAELDEFIRPLLRPTARLAGDLVRGSGVPITRVYLTGGASRIPLVATQLLRELDITPTLTEQPELVIAAGAARTAAGAAAGLMHTGPVTPGPPPTTVSPQAMPQPTPTTPIAPTGPYTPPAGPAFPDAPPETVTPQPIPPPLPGPPTGAAPGSAKKPSAMRRRSFLIGGLAAAGVAVAGTAGYLLWPRRPTVFTADEEVNGLAFNLNGSELAVSGKGPLQVWDTYSETHKWTSLSSGPTKGFSCVTFAPDGRIVAGRGKDLCIYGVDDKYNEDFQSATSKSTVRTVVVSTGGSMVTDGYSLYPLIDITKPVFDWGKPCHAAAYDSEDDVIVLAADDGFYKTDPSEANNPPNLKPIGKDNLVNIDFDLQNKIFVAAPKNASTGVRIYDAKSGKPIRTLTKDQTYAVAFHTDTNYMATAGKGGVRIWDAGSGDLVETVTESTARSVKFGFSGTTVAVGGFTAKAKRKKVELWSL